MSKYSNLLSPAYPTRVKRVEKVEESESIDELYTRFFSTCEPADTKSFERDCQINVPSYTLYHKMQTLFHENFKRVDANDRVPLCIAVMDKTEIKSGKQTLYRFVVDRDSFLIYPFIEEKIYYGAYMSRITASKVNIQGGDYDGFNFRAYYGNIEDLTSVAEAKFRAAIMFSDIED